MRVLDGSMTGVLLAAVAGFTLIAACAEDAAPPSSAAATETAPAEPTADPSGNDDAGVPSAASEGGVEGGALVDSASAASVIASFDDGMADAICTRLAACCNDDDYETFFNQYRYEPYDLASTPTTAQCRAALAQQLGKVHGRWAKSLASGRIVYDGARAAECKSAVANAACGAELTKAIYDPSCLSQRGNVFKKVTKPGAPCEDIKDGTFYGECDPALGFCGSQKVCEAWKKTGEACSITPTRAFCAPDLACDGLGPNKPGKCSGAPIERALGEDCSAFSGPYQNCVQGTYCGASGTCETQKDDGASCTSDDECKSSRPYTCRPVGAGKCGSSFCGGSKDGGSQ